MLVVINSNEPAPQRCIVDYKKARHAPIPVGNCIIQKVPKTAHCFSVQYFLCEAR